MANGSDILGAVGQDAEVTQMLSAVFLGLLAATGAVGNTMVAATVVRMAQLHRPIFILVGNMSVVGLLHSLLAIPLHVAHTLLGPASWQGRGEALCKVQGHVNFALVLATLINSAAIAVCRYKAVHATHSVRAHTGSSRAIAKLVVFIWALPTLVAVSASPFLGFNPLLSDCFFLTNVEQAFWYMNVALAGPALASTAVMLVTYALIIKKVRDSHNKISNFRVARPKGRRGDDAAPGPVDAVQARDNPHHNEDFSPDNKTGIVVFATMVSGEDTSGTSSTGRWPACPPEARFPTTTSVTLAPAAARNSLLQLPPPHSSPPSAASVAETTDTVSVASRSSSSVSVGLNEDGSVTRGQGGGGRGARQVKKEVNLSVRLFLAFILFCLLYLPLCLVHVVHASFSLTKDAWRACYTLALSFASNAWLVYALLNREFRRAFRALFEGRRSF